MRHRERETLRVLRNLMGRAAMTAAERKAIGAPPVKKLHVDPRDFLTLGRMYEAERARAAALEERLRGVRRAVLDLTG